MAEASGDVLALAMPGGRAEATRMGRAEAGQSRWCIRYPWCTETFYGTAERVVAHMEKRAADREAAASRGSPSDAGT